MSVNSPEPIPSFGWIDLLSDNGSFLPSAAQRYHQLLLPSLQTVAGVIAALGSQHLTATNQVGLVLLLNNSQIANSLIDALNICPGVEFLEVS